MTTRPILVVEDEPDLLENMRELLQDEGYEVYTARNGREALSILGDAGRPAPGLVALDLTMPVMDGGAFLHVYAEDPASRSPSAPKVVLVTAAELLPAEVPPERTEAVLRKPINIDNFLGLVARYCGRPA